MPILVDAYNVLHVTGVLPPELAGLEPHDLARLVENSRYRRHSVRLICDGAPPPGATASGEGRVRIEFAGPGRSADAAIARAVEASSAPKRLVVVSNDRAVRRHARRRRAKILEAEAFLRHLALDARREITPRSGGIDRTTPLSREEVRRWRRAFGLDPNADDAAS